MAQERIDNWWEYARELAKAECELKIEKWVYISIEYRTKELERVVLFHYDLPREIYERYRWVSYGARPGFYADIRGRMCGRISPIMTNAPG